MTSTMAPAASVSAPVLYTSDLSFSAVFPPLTATKGIPLLAVEAVEASFVSVFCHSVTDKQPNTTLGAADMCQDCLSQPSLNHLGYLGGSPRYS